MLKLTPMRHETRQIVTLSGTTKQSLPIFEVTITSLDGKMSEKIELTGSKLSDFTTVHRPNLSDLKSKYKHTADKGFYMKQGDEYRMHVILGDSTYCRIKTEEVLKGTSVIPQSRAPPLAGQSTVESFRVMGVGSLGRSRIVSNCVV